MKEDPSERDALVQSLPIPVTEFFRDPAAWQALKGLNGLPPGWLLTATRAGPPGGEPEHDRAKAHGDPDAQ